MYNALQEILVYISLAGAVYLLLSHFGLFSPKKAGSCGSTGCSCSPLKDELRKGQGKD